MQPIPPQGYIPVIADPPTYRICPATIAADFCARADQEAARKEGREIDYNIAFAKHMRKIERQLVAGKQPRPPVYRPAVRYRIDHRREVAMAISAGLLAAAGLILLLR